ncbi:MAG: fatty acid kinase [Gaiellales bacterium]|nr:fatty acid kinase [Gaiellales bacterium]
MSDPGALATDGQSALLLAVDTACATLAAARHRIDDLNVFPVPDGDTGTNMARTAEAVAIALRELGPADAAAQAAVATRAALMGARGNSGIILSQVVRGAVEQLVLETELDGDAIARALRAARDAAYAAVSVPVEGTMLTVLHEMARGAAETQTVVRERALEAALAAGEEALARTPEQLPRLREAGVVDAGGAGLVELLRGLLAGLRGEPAPAPLEAAEPTAAVALDALHLEVSRYRYCTSFLVEGETIERATLEASLDPFGDSILVVGAAPAFKAHVHTDDPGGVLRVGTSAGVIGGVEVSDMHAQTAERQRRLAPERACDVVFISCGAGNRALAESLGSRAVVDRGAAGDDPSTAEIVAAIDATRAQGVLVLPNDSSALLAAESAAAHAGKPARVLASRSLAEGACALVAYLPDADLEANARAMTRALAGVRSGEVSRAARDATIDGVSVAEGEWIALASGTALAAFATPEPALQAVAEELLEAGGEILTVLLGAGKLAGGPLAAAAAALATTHPGLEVAVHEGGQAHPVALLAVE